MQIVVETSYCGVSLQKVNNQDVDWFCISKVILRGFKDSLFESSFLLWPKETNLFGKTNGQSQACLNFVVARKGARSEPKKSLAQPNLQATAGKLIFLFLSFLRLLFFTSIKDVLSPPASDSACAQDGAAAPRLLADRADAVFAALSAPEEYLG